MRYKAIYKRNPESEETIGVYNKRETAVTELIRYADRNVNYCLDTKEDRIQALELRNWYVCGCGPQELLIEEVE